MDLCYISSMSTVKVQNNAKIITLGSIGQYYLPELSGPVLIESKTDTSLSAAMI